MKIDQRLLGLLSKEQMDQLIRRAEKLSEDEGKVFNFVISGFIYPVAVTSKEISAYPFWQMQ